MSQHPSPLRIGCASGFWGDTNTAAFQLVKQASIDFLVFDYLSEITMSILARAMEKNPEEGYATDFVTRVMQPLLADLAQKKIRVVSNAGGINPHGCAKALQALIDAAQLSLKVAVVDGDHLLPQLDQLRMLNITEMFDGRPLPDALTSMNAYLGAGPVAQALNQGADIVITGRIADSVLALGPLIHHFSWSMEDYDRLAQGSLAGHLIECGAQCTGGNFTDWHTVPGFENMGFPIAECYADGHFIISKPEGTGGLVSVATVAEQLVYEIGDPAAYLLPDVCCDFSQVSLKAVGEHRVEVTGARGRPATSTYKVCATYRDGYRVSASFMLGGIEARRKGQVVAKAILSKVQQIMARRGAPPFTETLIEILGSEWTYGPHSRAEASREVIVRLSARHFIKETLLFLAAEIAQAATGMAPGITGIVGGRPKVTPVIRLYSFLLDKTHVIPRIHSNGHTVPVLEITTVFSDGQGSAPLTDPDAMETTEPMVCVPLVQLAWARSGDKGDYSNIGVIARQAQWLPWIYHSVNARSVRAWMAHLLDERSQVQVYALPGIHGLNFLITHALGGGGIASLRTDPQGKAFAQQLLEIPVSIPASLITSGVPAHD